MLKVYMKGKNWTVRIDKCFDGWFYINMHTPDKRFYRSDEVYINPNTIPSTRYLAYRNLSEYNKSIIMDKVEYSLNRLNHWLENDRRDRDDMPF